MIVLPKVKQSNKKSSLCLIQENSKHNFKGFSTNVVNDTKKTYKSDPSPDSFFPQRQLLHRRQTPLRIRFLFI